MSQSMEQHKVSEEGSPNVKKQIKPPATYELGKDGHYGACQALTASGNGADSNLYTGPWTNVNQGLPTAYRPVLSTYWSSQLHTLENSPHDYKSQQLPLARIKKVMKADPEVKMISAEAPILFAKGCDIFITELTMRAWIHAEENKRRTLQRSDIASALGKSDMFDFLIDIVPREDAQANASTGSHAKRPSTNAGTGSGGAGGLPPNSAGLPPQQHQQQQQPSQIPPGPSSATMPQHPQQQQHAPQPGVDYATGYPPGHPALQQTEADFRAAAGAGAPVGMYLPQQAGQGHEPTQQYASHSQQGMFDPNTAAMYGQYGMTSPAGPVPGQGVHQMYQIPPPQHAQHAQHGHPAQQQARADQQQPQPPGSAGPYRTSHAQHHGGGDGDGGDDGARGYDVG